MLNPQFWAGRRVLLTGHTGFKGSWLALWLSQLGAQVHGVALAPDTRPALFEQLELISRLAGHHLLDIGDAAGLAAIAAACQPEVVLHLAAQPLVRRSYRDPLGTWATNVQGSLHLLEAIKHSSRAYIFDNSTDSSNPRLAWLAEVTDGQLLELKTDRIPAWFQRAVIQKIA
jgi:CDP-glucose 4,6-dehydratase